ncbi:hypothetical protein RB195_018188 [Necator americanus]|uniref:Peptidase family M13 n=1 Tax=Necator americanus TaxID=51031 RepID=A0ABR1CA84_NECAM
MIYYEFLELRTPYSFTFFSSVYVRLFFKFVRQQFEVHFDITSSFPNRRYYVTLTFHPTVAMLFGGFLAIAVANVIFPVVSEPNRGDVLPCEDFCRHACSTKRTSAAFRENFLNEFNAMLNDELRYFPDAFDRMITDVTRKSPRIKNEEFTRELKKRCTDADFIENYLRAAIEEIGDSSPLDNSKCSEMAATITEIVLDDNREPTEQVVDVIKKVRDMIAFDKLREEKPRIPDAFRLTTEFFNALQQGYLAFINSTSSTLQSPEAAHWYQTTSRLSLELPMRTNKFFRNEHLDILTNEYFNCTEKWVLGIDGREKAFCLSRAWRLAYETIPMPTRLAEFLHDLRSLNVRVVNNRIYVRPAYALLLLNTTDEAVLLSTLGSEIAREITRASYEAPLAIHRCFRQHMKDNCDETPEECNDEANEFLFKAVALRATFNILQKKQDKYSEENSRKFFYSSAFLDCANEPSPTFSLMNVDCNVSTSGEDMRAALTNR